MALLSELVVIREEEVHKKDNRIITAPRYEDPYTKLLLLSEKYEPLLNSASPEMAMLRGMISEYETMLGISLNSREVPDYKLSHLKLRPYTVRALAEKLGVKTLSDLLSRTQLEIFLERGIGKHILEEVNTVLAELGFRLDQSSYPSVRDKL